jgi:pimeloyl-ACP methyl ester carboxylesterase
MNTLAGLALLACTTAAPTAAKIPPPAYPGAQKSGVLPVNGVAYYYEVHGQGEPLLLLHGGLGSIEMFGPVLPLLAQKRTVIAVDLHGHGRTALGERPFSLAAMGDDMAALVQQLGYEQVDVMGYSLGGGVAFRMAVQHPARVRRLVLVSTGFSDDAFYPALKQQQVALSGQAAPMMKDTPMYQTYAPLAPRPADFPKLLDVLGDFMRSKYDSSADVANLRGPVLLVFGDSDMYRPEHVVKFYQLLGGGLQDAGWDRKGMSKNRLAILPDATHYDIFATPRIAATVQPFLDGVSDAQAWTPPR